MKESDHESYLGDEIGCSVAESVRLTIRKRMALVKKYTFRRPCEAGGASRIDGVRPSVRPYTSKFKGL